MTMLFDENTSMIEQAHRLKFPMTVQFDRIREDYATFL